MTQEEFETRHKQYIKKSEYYRRKADRLYEQYFEEVNKGNKFLKTSETEINNETNN